MREIEVKYRIRDAEALLGLHPADDDHNAVSAGIGTGNVTWQPAAVNALPVNSKRNPPKIRSSVP